MSRGTFSIAVVVLVFGCASCRSVNRTSNQTAAQAPSASQGTSTEPRGAHPSVETSTPSSARALVSAPLHEASCSRLPPLAEGIEPIGPKGIDVRELAVEARAGKTPLISAMAVNPNSPGGDPDFDLRDEDGLVYQTCYAVFPAGVLDAGRFRLNQLFGATVYKLVGRYSGRKINYYEWYRMHSGQEPDPKSIESELREQWRMKWPEFCVHRWCFVPDPIPGASLAPEDRPAARKEYAQLVLAMKAAGAEVCKNVRSHPPRGVGRE